jgi:hypothetical protein
VTPTLIGRGTYDPFELKTDAKSPLERRTQFEGTAGRVGIHDYALNSSTGWHTHRGPLLITVIEGTVTFYKYDALGAPARRAPFSARLQPPTTPDVHTDFQHLTAADVPCCRGCTSSP